MVLGRYCQGTQRPGFDHKAMVFSVFLLVALSGCATNNKDAVRIETEAATITAITPAQPLENDSRVEVTVFGVDNRDAAPEISGKTLEGDPIALSDLLGQVVIFNTWASWCGPCEDELPILIDVGEKYLRDGVVLLGLNVEDQPSDARTFAKKLNIKFLSIVDPDAKLLASLPGVPPRALPSTLIIDRNGNVGARIVGPVKAGVIDEILDEWFASS